MTGRRSFPGHPRASRGVTLVELMVAIVLGLIVSGAALALFMTNQKTYTASESLGRIQESERTAFELMSRDVRDGAGNACENGLNVANILNNPTSSWYTDFGSGIKGYDNTTGFSAPAGDAVIGTARFNRVSGTDAIELKSSVSSGAVILNQPGGPSADIKINAITDFQSGDIVMACNFDHAVVFQISQINGGGVNVVHNTGAATPGNCSKGLGYPAVCSATGTYYDFGANTPGVLAKLRATRWYIGYNGRSYNGAASKSLYQSTVRTVAGAPTVTNNEIAQGVSDMQLKYLVSGSADYVDASAGTDWKNVVAVNIALTMEGEDKVGTNSAMLTRNFQHIVTLRNRMP